jgi:hypothetical protein
VSERGWQREFEDPILLPDGTQLRTLREAIAYLAKTVPKAERDMPEVLAAAEMLTNAAERESAWLFFTRAHAPGHPPERDSYLQPRTQRPSLGQAEAKTRPLNIYVTVRQNYVIAGARLGCRFIRTTIRRLL